jgi:hypothetical protein
MDRRAQRWSFIVRDARFSVQATHEQQILQLCEQGAARLGELGEPHELIAMVGNVLRGESVAGIPQLLGAEVVNFAQGREVRSGGALSAIARHLAAAATSGEPSAERVQAHAERLHRSPAWVLNAFEREVLALLGRLEPTPREAWLKAFEAAPPRPLPPPAAGPPPSIEVFRPQAGRKINSPFELWDDRDADPEILLLCAYAPGTLLREIDPDRWFRAVDQWHDARLVYGALWGEHVLHDAEALLRWLAMASPTFDAAGDWTGRSAAAVLTLRVLEHAEALVTTTRPSSQEFDDEAIAISDLRDRELPALFQEAWIALLARPDGLALATALHAHLGAPNSWPRSYRVDWLGIARESLERALTSGRSSVRLLRLLHGKRQAAGEAARGAHASALTALRAAATIASDDSANDLELLEWFSELLTSKAADWDAFTHQGAVDGLLAALALRFARIPDVVERLDASYRALEFGRRIGEFARGRGLNDAQRASVVLLALLLNVLLNRADAPEGTREALGCAFERALRLVLVSQDLRIAGSVSPRPVLTYAVALTAKFDPESLARRLASLMSDPGHAAECVKMLLDAALVPGEVLQRALGVASLQDFAAWIDTWARATDAPEDRAVAASLTDMLQVERHKEVR